MTKTFNGFGPGTRGFSESERKTQVLPEPVSPRPWWRQTPRYTTPDVPIVESVVEPSSLPAYKSTELDKMSTREFADLVDKTTKEMARRAKLSNLFEPPKPVLYAARTLELRKGLSNFLAGVAHAAACRAALRLTAGWHPFGVTPQSGEKWNPLDGFNLAQMAGTKITTDHGKGKSYTLYSNPLAWRGSDIARWLTPVTLTGDKVEKLNAPYMREVDPAKPALWANTPATPNAPRF